METRTRGAGGSVTRHAGPTATQVLVVDDDPGVVDMLREWLEGAGYRVECASDGKEGLRSFFETRPVLAVVDLRMPRMDGFQLISRIRELSEIPILVLSALSGEQQIVQGLDLGADEYLVKPITRDHFLARIRSLLRRTPPEDQATALYSDATLTLDIEGHEVSVDGEPVKLRPLEFRLLAYLVQNQERMVSHHELLDQVWGPAEGSLDSLKWYVSSLRRKIEVDPQKPHLLVNVRSLGYRYVPPLG